jgi:hypothetical protein
MDLIRRNRLSVCLLISIWHSPAANADVVQNREQHFSPLILQSDAGATDWKEVFAQVFAANIASDLVFRGLPSMIPDTINRSLYYTTKSRSELLSSLQNAGSSSAAYDTMKKALELTADGSLKLLNSGSAMLSGTGAQALVAAIMENRAENRTDDTGRYNFFDTPAGKAVNQAMSDYLLVIVPGYSSHTSDVYTFMDILEDANEHYQRTSSKSVAFGYRWQRPRIEDPDAHGVQRNKFMSTDEFYGSSVGEVGFDVVSPMGLEIGDSVAKNEDMEEAFGTWLLQVLNNPKYSGKPRKLILLGYSKGGQLIHNVTKWAKEKSPDRLYKSIQYLVTSGAPLQGAVPATNGFKRLRKELTKFDPQNPVRTDAEVIVRLTSTLKAAGKFAAEKLSEVLSKFGGVAQGPLDSPIISSSLERMGIDPKKFAKELISWLETSDIERLLGGMKSMTAYESLKWMTTNLNDNYFAGKTIFNLSGITDTRDFLLPPGNPEHPDGFDDYGPVNPPTIFPKFGWSNTGIGVDWSRFSIDNVCLFLLSRGGFEAASGGLFDSAIGWLDSKSIALDHRPLSESLDADEIADIGLPAANADRSELVLNRLQETSFIDLGNVRATHWETSLRQAYTPPKVLTGLTQGKTFENTFPRRAYQAAIIETIAMYHILSAGHARAR